jgi:lysozyme
MSLDGIDVSHHQGQVKWSRVAGAGIAFAYAKATEGATFRDSVFSTNWREMKEAGLRRGAYHFFRPSTPAAAQIDSFAAAVGQLDIADLPPMIDIEEAPIHGGGGDEWDTVAADARVPLVLAALARVKERFGRRPIVYVRRGFITAKLPHADALGEFPLWVAHFTDAPQPSIPAQWTRWTFWQHSEQGQVDGIAGPVDLDRFNGTVTELGQL